jgi:hypothetical protein
MTVEELEEYIQKNRDKMNKYKNNDSHSLNKSFTSHYNFGMPEKIDKIDKEVQNTFSVKTSISPATSSILLPGRVILSVSAVFAIFAEPPIVSERANLGKVIVLFAAPVIRPV